VEGKPILQGLSLQAKAGQKVAIVGPTGGGKTTLVNLLMRFYEPQKGRIFIDEQDIAFINREALRDNISMVLQDTWLFDGTVAENIAYGKEGATREDVEQAAKSAYADGFISLLPNGYDTVLSDATALSGGQKQLLTIARAFLSDKPILILDEATSDVDTRTEIYIQKAMDRLQKQKTCFVIAHRLSTIVHADKILAIDKGEIVDIGKHEELLKKGSVLQN
jgi:ATP-binding cassette subfamily B protein